MKQYNTPEIEVIELKNQDVILASGLNPDGEGNFDDVIEWT